MTRLDLISLAVYNTGKMGLVSLLEPMCLGHESSGIIVEVGTNVAAQAVVADKLVAQLASSSSSSGPSAIDAEHDAAKARGVVGRRALRLGDRVTMEPGVTCRMCVDCRGGKYQVRFDQVVALHRPVP